jgi:transcriptional regulator with XRE-family HTH domain
MLTVHPAIYGGHVNRSRDAAQGFCIVNLTFGERIALARGRAALSQEALADAVNVHRNAVAKWEADERLPEGRAMVELPGALRISGHWLLTGDGDMALPNGTEAIRLEIIGRIADGGNLTPEAAARLQGSPEDVGRAVAEMMIVTARASGR